MTSLLFRIGFFAVAFIYITFQATWSSATRCKHEVPPVSSVITRVAVYSKRRFLRQLSPSSLRIHVHYDESIRLLSDFDEIKRCRYIKNGSHILSGNQGHGLKDTDFILYIASLPTARCHTGKVLGYAAHCQLASQTDRPIAGYINFCPNTLGSRVSDRVRSLFVTKHELLHALGFSSSLFAMYRDHQNRPLTPRDPTTQLPALGLAKIGSHAVYQWSDKVVRVVERRWMSAYGNHTKLAHIVVTPTVLQVARKFFDCPTLDGVELEDQDEVGVFLTHWEKRLLENELMTATYTNSYRVSPITLAMMEDTGWYLANYTMSHDFSWGGGLGCSFAMASCLEYMLERRQMGRQINPFCQQIQPPLHRTEDAGVQVSCTPDGVSYGFCNLIHHPKPLPREYVYFVQGPQSFKTSSFQEPELASGFGTDREKPLDTVGGKIALANYCPYYQEIEWERKWDEPTINTHCHTLNNYKEPKNNFRLEQFTPKSICVQHLPRWRLRNNKQVFGSPVEGAGCYSFRCSIIEGGLVIELAGGIALPCVVPGSTVRVKACLKSQGLSIDGQLVCPECSLFCDPRECPLHMRNFSQLHSSLRKFTRAHTISYRPRHYSLPTEAYSMHNQTAISPRPWDRAVNLVQPQEIVPDFCPSSSSTPSLIVIPQSLRFVILISVHLFSFFLS
ncbi:leishmanolysin-like peptidase [Clonorchis sinensis]|uniref:Leishmanolysin-like peptidase n=1 Tax=Clonorchis sinensis TaxID=79923 RepID=G7Y569_CLOSI|nr:leishmanolysin-like peptidase [Clonorchis sinensis]